MAGKLYGCGEIDGGKLGWPPTLNADNFTPQLVNGSLGKVVSVKCGHNHSVALTGNRNTCW